MVLVYLSAPIIHSALRKEEFCNRVLSLLEDMGFTVFAPQFLGPAEPAIIYKRDVENLRMCDFVLAEVSNPSLGVGMEIMLAIELMKPVIMFFKGEIDSLSKMILGADGKVLIEYDNLADVEKKLRSHNLENLIVQKCPVCDSQVAEALEDGIRCIGCGSGGHEITV